MRAILLLTALCLSTVARAEEAKAPAALPADAESCRACHEKDGGAPEVDFNAFATSLHGQNGIGCTDCHAGYKEGPHEGELTALSADEQSIVDRLKKGSWGEGEKKHAVTAPRAYLACSGCHATEAEAFQKSIHAKWLRQDTGAPGATCASCHGSPHALTAKLAPYEPKGGARVEVPADRRQMVERCAACHGNEEFAKAAGLNPEAVVAYHDSIHGRLVRVGNQAAPACMSCHAAPLAEGGTHAILAKTEAASTVSAQNKRETCARCHPGASDNFAGLVAHKPLHETGGHVVPHVVHVAFSYLTTLTLLFFAFHVLIDFIYELRMRLSKKPGHGASPDATRAVVRFDIHQRIQHWFMLSGVILLGLTGWPLRGAGDQEAAAYSRAFMKVFGGAEGAALWHRVGAVLIIISSVYHLFYLTFLASKKRLPLSMLPVPKDALDMRDNILFMMGVKKERPRFDRFMYLEKFDYWAVFWGIVMMVGTGFIFWFPVWFAGWAPAWLITAAQIIHGEEATLAILFLFTVHFYNVHLKPSIFPMNWAWLNGKISVEALKHEHPLEYERMKGEKE